MSKTRASLSTHPAYRMGYRAGLKKARKQSATVIAALERQIAWWSEIRMVERREVVAVIDAYLRVLDAGDVADDYPLRNLAERRRETRLTGGKDGQ